MESKWHTIAFYGIAGKKKQVSETSFELCKDGLITSVWAIQHTSNQSSHEITNCDSNV